MPDGLYRMTKDFEPESSPEIPEVPLMRREMLKRLSPAETGLVSAVSFNAEGRDDDDIQDASRTTDETTTTPEEKAVTAMNQKTTVLIIEDTTELAEVIQATLERMDMETFHETHGNRALVRFVEKNPDVVLLDISLPDMTGWKIMDAIKARLEETNGEMPKVIVITAYDDPANRLVGKLQGVHGYLIKPFTSDEIENAVKQAIGGTAPK